MKNDDKLVTIETTTAMNEGRPLTPEVGQWYWMKSDKKDGPWLGCVTHVGTNYVEVSSVGGWTRRIHFEEWVAVSEYAPDALEYCDEQVALHQDETRRLLGATSSRAVGAAAHAGGAPRGSSPRRAGARRAAGRCGRSCPRRR